jgi:hypothetical protein
MPTQVGIHDFLRHENETFTPACAGIALCETPESRSFGARLI